MDTTKLDTLKILDCTIRDGGHLNNWNFPKELVQSYFQSVKNSGIDIIEIGYRSTPYSFPNAGKWRYTPDNLIREIIGGEDLEAKIAVMVDVGKIKPSDLEESKYSPIDLVRVAFYKEGIDEGLDLVQHLSEKGYETGVNMMATFQYSQDEYHRALESIAKTNADVSYVVDSFGSLNRNVLTKEVSRLVSLMSTKTNKSIGFHAHNNLQLAFSNTIQAIESGANHVDVTIGGMGRGAGNLPTELLLSALVYSTNRNFSTNEILKFADSELRQFTDKSVLKWGYQLPFLLTGVKGIHPNYAKYLIEEGFPIEDMQKIINHIYPEKTLGFDKEVLNSAIEKSYKESGK